MSSLALATEFVTDNGTRVEWVSESQDLRPGQTHWLGLSITPAEGWHTYWRNAGAAGAPASLDVAPNPAVVIGGLRWPAPQRKVFEGLNVYGYESSVLLAMPAVLTQAQSVELTGQASWLVCKELCIPESAQLTIRLQPGEGQPSDQARRFAQTRARWPASDPLEGLWDAANGRASVALPAGATQGQWAFFPYQNDIWPAEQYQEVQAFDGRVVFDVKPSQTWPKGELVHVSSGQSWRVNFQPGSVARSMALGWMALGAFMGGLILNLMPCVFPVLSIKAMGLAGLSGMQRTQRRLKGHAFLAGVLTSFAVLGAVLLVLKQAGAAIGWGFQLQSVWFVGAMALLMAALAASMLGFFKLGGAFMGIGQSLTQKPGYQSEFYTGVLAVLVASPCTAPFMGPALGFALASEAWVLMTILLSLGLGFAAPMWLIHQFEGPAHWLPRPGAWMETLQHVLAFPMLATAAWLAWVAARQLGVTVQMGWFLAPVLLAFLWYAFHRFSRSIAGVLAGSLLAVSAWAYWPAQARGVQWQPFSDEALLQAQDMDQTVLVNVTADWCISCLSNERLVFADPEVGGVPGVVWLKADWTDYDPSITAYLDEFGRAGVPLYVVYRGGQSRVLPQLLTVNEVITAVTAP